MSDKAEPDFYTQYATTVLGFPEGWRWYDIRARGEDRATGAAEVIGGVPVDPAQAWGYPIIESTKRTFIVSFREHEAFIAKWRQENPNV